MEDEYMNELTKKKKLTGFFKLDKGNFEKVDDAFTYKKEDVEKLHCNLSNIANVVREAFESLDAIDDHDLILAIGNTGCGKSTMLSSILFGTESLELIKQGKGKKKIIE